MVEEDIVGLSGVTNEDIGGFISVGGTIGLTGVTNDAAVVG